MSTYKRNKKDEELQFSYPAYEKSDAVKQAEAQLQQHTSGQPSAYRSQYQDQMSSLLSQLQNRPDFQYDVNADALYHYYKDRYTHNGQRAMQDTMGQAAALTGGYGSSYAQSVGQQAYNEYMMGLNDVIPELYQLALDRYDRETAKLQDRYAMYANLDAQDYSRWQDQRNDYYSELDRLTDNARYEAEQDWSRYASGYNAAYDQYQKAVEEAEENAKYTGIVYDDGSVSRDNIKTMQRLLGVAEDGYWGKVAYEKAGKRTAGEAWEDYQQGKLQGRSRAGMTTGEWAEVKNAQPKASDASSKNTLGGYTIRASSNTAKFKESVPSRSAFGGGSAYQEYIENKIEEWLDAGKLDDDDAATLLRQFGFA